MWLDVTAGILLLAFVVLGAMRGTLVSALHILSLAGAYVAAIMGGPRLGPALAERFTLPGTFGVIAGGALAFVGALVAGGALTRLIQVWMRGWRDGDPRSALDRVGGALLGATQAAFIIFLLGLLGGFLEAARATGTLTAIPAVGPSRVAETSQKVAEQGAQLLVGDDDAGTRVAVRMVTRPADSVQRVQALLENPRIVALQEDQAFWAYVGAGSLDHALNQASFLGLAYDESTRQSLAELGLIQPSDASDPRLFRAAMREVLVEAAPKIHALRSDPEVQRMLRDPELVALLESGNTLALIAHPTMRTVIDRVMAAGSDPQPPAASTPADY